MLWKLAASLLQLNLNCFIMLLIFSNLCASLCFFIILWEITCITKTITGMSAVTIIQCSTVTLPYSQELVLRTRTVSSSHSLWWHFWDWVKSDDGSPTQNNRHHLSWVRGRVTCIWHCILDFYVLAKKVPFYVLTKKVAFSNRRASSASIPWAKRIRFCSSSLTLGISK